MTERVARILRKAAPPNMDDAELLMISRAVEVLYIEPEAAALLMVGVLGGGEQHRAQCAEALAALVSGAAAAAYVEVSDAKG